MLVMSHGVVAKIFGSLVDVACCCLLLLAKTCCSSIDPKMGCKTSKGKLSSVIKTLHYDLGGY